MIKKTEEYFRKKLKNDEAVEIIKLLVKKEGLVRLYEQDFINLVDNSDEFEFYNGNLKDIKKISKTAAKNAVVYLDLPEEGTLDEVLNIAEIVTHKLSDDATIIWAANMDSTLKDAKIFVMVGK